MHGLAAAAEIVASAFGVGADDAQFGRRPQALMAGAGRQHRDVAGDKFEHLARLAAEAYLCASARDAERLVDHRMIVHVGKNAVAPHVAPTVGAKRALDDALGACLALEGDGAAIDQKRQMRIVGYGAVVAKHQRERLRRSTGRGHGLLSLRLSFPLYERFSPPPVAPLAAYAASHSMCGKKDLRPVREMHRIVVIPLAAPDETVRLEN